VRRTSIALFGILAIGLGSLSAGPSAAAGTATALAVKDPCLAKASKWDRQQCENFTRSAPGDEYFGKMKLSYLGINNTFHDETIRAGDYTTDSNIINKVGFADDALQAWASKYPGDPELARSYFLAITMYKKIYTQTYQEKAFNYMHVIVARFGTSYFGKLEKADLARGFTEHYFANAQICPTPLPSGVTVDTTPSATATPQPAPGAAKIDMITPPCVAPLPIDTSSPVATPTP